LKAQAASHHSIYFKKLLTFPRIRIRRISSGCRKAAAIIHAMVVSGGAVDRVHNKPTTPAAQLKL
jgi:hypothetical protein